MMGGHMNRDGARHVGEPRLASAKGDRTPCLYAAAMVAKHAPAFAAAAHEFEMRFAPPATVLLARQDDPDGPVITYQIPAAMIAAGNHARATQPEFGDAP